jgi:hypothetical protein
MLENPQGTIQIFYYKTKILEGRDRARPYGGTWKNRTRKEQREVQSLQEYLQTSTIS